MIFFIRFSSKSSSFENLKFDIVSIVSSQKKIEKCVEAEHIRRPNRTNKMEREFIDLTTAGQKTISRALETAKTWKIRRVKMASFCHDTDNLMLQYVSCSCVWCLEGKIRFSTGISPIKMIQIFVCSESFDRSPRTH